MAELPGASLRSRKSSVEAAPSLEEVARATTWSVRYTVDGEDGERETG